MTNEQLDIVLAALADKIASQEITIACQKYEIENLKAKNEENKKDKE